MTTLSPTRVLWTGFEPFGIHEYNPSWDVARAAGRTMPPALEPEVERLPVEFDYVRRWTAEQLSLGGPTLAVHVGLAESRSTIDVEAIAHNRVGDRPDEAGEQLGREVVDPRADEAAIVTPFPVEQFATHLDAFLDAPEFPEPSVSESAGSFVCNALYYHSLRRLVGSGSTEVDSASVFIHVPPVDSTTATQLGAAIGMAVGTLLGETTAPNSTTRQ